MSEKKLEQIRDVCLTIMAILGVLTVVWTVATKDMQYQINNNTKAIITLQNNELSFIKWSEIAQLNDQLNGMNGGVNNGIIKK